MPDENRIAPIALPANSFELRDLRDALDSAVSVKDHEQHPERVMKAIAKCAKNPEVLANMNRQSVPDGASLVEVEVVESEGADPVKRERVIFDEADAKTGEEAAKMSYVRQGEKVITTDEPEAVAAEERETLADAAADVVGASTSGTGAGKSTK